MQIHWAGWYRNDSSDKIWGIITVNDAHFNFWCRRGARMQFKATNDLRYLHKANKGYKQITAGQLESIYPGFFEEAENKLIFDLLSGRVK